MFYRRGSRAFTPLQGAGELNYFVAQLYSRLFNVLEN
jgi:hypothetical protein